ncbi:hypothetical protein BSKO_06493 [Bryopsis sp. KO-2023]|nr:hypothetical protein BSKO_06493 [Bryopsis sp. KO-2023]
MNPLAQSFARGAPRPVFHPNIQRKTLLRGVRSNQGALEVVASGQKVWKDRKSRKGSVVKKQVSIETRRQLEGARLEGRILLEETARSLPEIPVAILRHGKATYVERGNALIFPLNIHKIDRPDNALLGAPIIIKDGNEQCVGWGVFNPNSQYRIRVLQIVTEMGKERDAVLDVEKLLQRRIRAAVGLRAMLGLPSESINVYRLINSDGDRLSGLVVDVFDQVLVVSSTAAWLERYQELIIKVLKEETGYKNVLWRPAPAVLELEGMPNMEAKVFSEDDSLDFGDTLTVHENGVKFHVNLAGQKTGFYIDQRESREFIRKLSSGHRVLDLCCYSGGFAINAAAGGATEVKGVDSSADAIELARKNAVLNGVDEVCSFVEANIVNYMTTAAENGELWDVVILDPPKLAPTRSALPKAKGRYRKLNRAAVKLVKPGGLLMTCSCSGAMTMSGQFPDIVKESVTTLGRSPVLIRKASASPDHVINPSHLEGEYLTNLVVSIQ